MKKITFTFLPILLLSLGVFSSCAKEDSQADNDREARDRAFDRLKGAVGHYDGYIQRPQGGVVPFSMDLVAKYLSDKPSAQLQADVKVGLFGGVSISADAVTYDDGSGLLNVSFNQAALPGSVPGGLNQPTTLTVTATVLNNSISNAVVRGANSGQQSLTFSAAAQALSTTTEQFTYGFSFSKGMAAAKTLEGELTIVRKLEGELAPPNVDLPEIPALTASLHFAAMNTYSFQKVIYDPLTGNLDLILSDAVRISFQNLALTSASSTAVIPTSLVGSLNNGGAVVSDFTAVLNVTNSAPSVAQPPHYYSGTLTGPTGSIKVAANLNYLGADGHNPAFNPFATFASNSLLLYFCAADGSNYGSRFMDLDQVDLINHQIVYHEQAGSQPLQFTGKYSLGWSEISGQFQSSQGTSGANQRLNLHAIPDSSWRGCAH